MNIQTEQSDKSRLIYNIWKQSIDKTFELCSKELGLDNSNVELRFSVRDESQMPPGVAGRTSKLFTDDQHIAVQLSFPCFTDKREFLRVFCHEMIHVQQEISGDLIDTEDGAIWKNQHFSMGVIELANLPFVDEDLLPWEKDAYTRGPILARKFYNQIPWPSNWRITLLLAGGAFRSCLKRLIRKLL